MSKKSWAYIAALVLLNSTWISIVVYAYGHGDGAQWYAGFPATAIMCVVNAFFGWRFSESAP